MFRQIQMLLTIIMLSGMSSLWGASLTVHPALTIDGKFEVFDEPKVVSPYITSVYAIDLLEHGGHVAEVRSFILWYIAHLNRSDIYGVSGSIYDYLVDPKTQKEKSLQQYDSADGYAGMFLYLLKRYYEMSGDRKLIEKVYSRLKDVVYLIYYLRDPKDSLTYALPKKDYRTKYLMDNVESWIGVDAYISLSEVLGKGKEEEVEAYRVFRNELGHSIVKYLYDPQNGLFHWAKEGNETSGSTETKFYPDIFAQIHLLAFFGKEIDREKRVLLWQKIKRFILKKGDDMELFRPVSEDEEGVMAMEQIIIFEWAKAFALTNNL